MMKSDTVTPCLSSLPGEARAIQTPIAWMPRTKPGHDELEERNPNASNFTIIQAA
jgi:hypothetical protein